MKKTKLFLLVSVILIVVMFYATGLHHEFDLKNIQENLEKIQDFYAANPIAMTALFLAAYVFITSMSIPGAIVLTLLAGAVFGVWLGTFLVSLASTTGATIAFFISRYLFRESMMLRFQKRLHTVNRKMHENGNSYLFTLRLIPVSPYVVINILMGLTDIRTWSFVWITFVAMFPGNFVYVYAGRKISEIKTPSEILTWPIILTLTLIGAFPLFLKGVGRLLANNKAATQEEL